MATSKPVKRVSALRGKGAVKRATNVSLNAAFLEEAKTLGINVSHACERGLTEQIAEERAARWLQENRGAIAESNAYVARHGVPLARYRRF